MAYEKNMNYAGFWKRFAAYVIDNLVLYVPQTILRLALVDDFDDDVGFGMYFIVSMLIYWIYTAAFESSSKQATPGKIALGIKVTDLNGRRIGFGKATGRNFGFILSTVILGIGLIMIAFTEKKQGLHDKMAGCLVVNK